MNGSKKMSAKKKVIVLCIILLAILAVGILFVLFSPIVFVSYFGLISPFQESLRQERLLCRTDHQALLETCRALSKEVATDHPDGGRAIIRVPDSELSRFPVIRELGSRQVFLNPYGAVSIELGGTMRHFGVNAYPEDFRVPFSNYNYGDKELIPGLWYCDDIYNRHKDYDKVIERLLKKNRYR